MGLAILRASGNQGYCGQRQSVYLDAHDAGTGTASNSHAIKAENDLDSYDNRFVIYRGFYDFPTDLGGATITAARLHLRSNLWGEVDAGHSTLHIVESVHHIPIIDEDYGAHLNKTTSGGSRDYVDRVIGYPGYLIELNSNGIGWLNSSGTTKLCLRSSGDIDASEPTDEPNHVFFDWGGSFPPANELEATNITKSSATLNAIYRGHRSPAHLEITYEGDNPEYPRLRFEYGKKSDYEGTKQQTSWQYGTALFTSITADIDNLAAGTTYQWRVESVDNGDTVYTALSEFTTTVVATRVSSLVHRWVPGSYTLEMVLGGVTSEFGLIIPTGKPAPTIPTLPVCQSDEVLTWSLEKGYYCMKVSDIPPGKY